MTAIERQQQHTDPSTTRSTMAMATNTTMPIGLTMIPRRSSTLRVIPPARRAYIRTRARPPWSLPYRAPTPPPPPLLPPPPPPPPPPALSLQLEQAVSISVPASALLVLLLWCRLPYHRRHPTFRTAGEPCRLALRATRCRTESFVGRWHSCTAHRAHRQSCPLCHGSEAWIMWSSMTTTTTTSECHTIDDVVLLLV